MIEERVKNARHEFAKKDGDRAALQALTDELCRTRVPPEPRLFADNCTPEALTSLLAEHGGRMAVLSAEGGIFDVMAGQYAKNGAPSFEVFLKGHAGDHLRVDRVGRPPERIDAPALTLGLTLQPEVIRGLSEVPGFRGRGLLGQSLYAMPHSNVGYRDVDAPPLAVSVEQAYAHGIHRMAGGVGINGLKTAPAANDGSGRAYALVQQDDVMILTLSPGAHAIFRDFRIEIEQRLRPGEDLHAISDWAGKLAGAAARVAGLLHLAEGRDEFDAIAESTMRGALSLARYFIPHAQAAFDEMGIDRNVSGARRIAEWIRAKNVTRFSKREAHNSMFSHFKKAADLDGPLRELVDRGFIRPVAHERSRPGRPSEEYDVNPKLRERGER